MPKKKPTDDEDYFSFVDEPEPIKRPDRKSDKRPEKKSAGWPDEVPVLVADDMTWEADHGPGNRRSIDWWLYHVFGGLPPVRGKYAEDKVRDVLREVLGERIGKKVVALWTFHEYANKHRTPKLAWHAACWNEAMRRLGYEIPGDRCRDPGIK